MSEKEYIERDVLLKAVDRLVKSASTVDVAEVVRCKHCKHCEFLSSCYRYMCNVYGGFVNESDFCSRAEKKDDNNND